MLSDKIKSKKHPLHSHANIKNIYIEDGTEAVGGVVLVAIEKMSAVKEGELAITSTGRRERFEREGGGGAIGDSSRGRTERRGVDTYE